MVDSSWRRLNEARLITGVSTTRRGQNPTVVEDNGTGEPEQWNNTKSVNYGIFVLVAPISPDDITLTFHAFLDVGLYGGDLIDRNAVRLLSCWEGQGGVGYWCVIQLRSCLNPHRAC